MLAALEFPSPVVSLPAALVLPRDLRAPSHARAFVSSLLSSRDEGAALVAELLVSEVVTNAVVHASSAPLLQVSFSPSRVRVSVLDSSSTLPLVRPASRDALGGRGMALVAELSAAWGVSSLPGGKSVWFELVL